MNNYSDKTTAQTITANLKRLGVKKIGIREGGTVMIIRPDIQV